MTRLVRFVCRAQDHQQLSLFQTSAEWAPNTLTYRDGAWAYCPSGDPDGHEWETIEDTPIELVRDTADSRPQR